MRSDNLICVITNDGWWGDTQGYKQHFSYSKLRAIESRKSLVRSANTGISGVILPNGGEFHPACSGIKKYLSTEVGIYDKKTFYNKYGDYLGRISAFISVMILLIFIPKKLFSLPKVFILLLSIEYPFSSKYKSIKFSIFI